ncbi:MAG TPA: hypothetical protein V6C72_05650, partial [Chroococcales cyanobacterium]
MATLPSVLPAAFAAATALVTRVLTTIIDSPALERFLLMVILKSLQPKARVRHDSRGALSA